MGLSIVLILAWIITCDGDLANTEVEALRQLAESSGNASELDLALTIAKQGRIEDLQLACEFITYLNRTQRRLFLQLAIGISLADGVLVTSESHILRFLADLFGLGPQGLDKVFREVTGHEFPASADSSSVDWWNARSSGGRERRTKWSREQDPSDDDEREKSSSATASAEELDRLRYLAVLGLDGDATKDDIRNAYRRMAKIHHPDRFCPLGPEAVRAAEHTFRRIQVAYEWLSAR